MKMVTAIIRPERFERVRAALEAAGFPAMTVTDVRGRGEQQGITLQYRAGDIRVDFLPKLKIEIVVTDEQSDAIVPIIIEHASTGRIGDGKIFISPVERAIRIRTAEEYL